MIISNNIITPFTYPSKIDFSWGYLPFACESTIYERKILVSRGCSVIFDRCLFGLTTYNKRFDLEDCKFIIRRLVNIKCFRLNNLLYVTDEWSEGPYHFFVDLLSRIMVLVENGVELKDLTLVLPDSDFMRKSASFILSELNFSFRDIIYWKSDQLYFVVGSVQFVSLPHRMGSNNTKLIGLIQRRLFSVTDYYDEKPYLNIYYFRKNRRRKVVNDDEVMTFLESKGFVFTDFDDMSYIQAWTLMAKAKLIMGIHGGGLTNMIYMPKGGSVIEFKTDNPNPQSHCYWHLSHSLGHNYVQFLAESSTPGNNTIEGSYGCDIKIDINVLSELLSECSI